MSDKPSGLSEAAERARRWADLWLRAAQSFALMTALVSAPTATGGWWNHERVRRGLRRAKAAHARYVAASQRMGLLQLQESAIDRVLRSVETDDDDDDDRGNWPPRR